MDSQQRDTHAQSFVFAYGTLLFDEIITALIGRVPPSEKAIVHNMRRIRVPGRPYPALISAPGHQVEGRLYHEISAVELKTIDQYEGEEYRKAQIMVTRSATNRPIVANVWLHASPEQVKRTEDWDPEKFRQFHLAIFLKENF